MKNDNKKLHDYILGKLVSLGLNYSKKEYSSLYSYDNGTFRFSLDSSYKNVVSVYSNFYNCEEPPKFLKDLPHCTKHNYNAICNKFDKLEQALFDAWFKDIEIYISELINN